MRNLIEKLVKDESGQDMAEYGIALAVIAVGAIAAFTALGTGVTGALSRATSVLTSAGS